MSSLNWDARKEYHCGLGYLKATQLDTKFSSLKSCLGSGALSSFCCVFQVKTALTSGGTSE